MQHASVWLLATALFESPGIRNCICWLQGALQSVPKCEQSIISRQRDKRQRHPHPPHPGVAESLRQLAVIMNHGGHLRVAAKQALK
jgi:hypothetical protein